MNFRCLEPEWLDELSPDDPRAVRSRNDLRRINALMGNARFIARHLSGRRIADLGGGDGALMRAVARRLERDDLEVINVERIRGLEVFDFLRQPGPALDAIVANLFLHHLEPESLRRLLALAAARAPLFIACEPRRSAPALWASRLVGLVGCNDVTHHDSVVSVRAGFRGKELSEAWPEAPHWELVEGPAWPFSHLFVARRYDG